MTSHVGRLYALSATLVVFFLAWAVIAAHPWSSAKTATDPRVAALAQREQRLRHEAQLVQQIVKRRFIDYRRHLAVYKAALAKRESEMTAARLASAAASAARSAPSSYSPGVRIVTLPPLVVTRTS